VGERAFYRRWRMAKRELVIDAYNVIKVLRELHTVVLNRECLSGYLAGLSPSA
jgi:hypothetical protein